MPDIKNYSTGRLGNSAPLHQNTDHVNTKGLDQQGLPGIEAYIDEDIVRAYDDNRPIFNLLTNDELLSFSIDRTADSIDFGATLKAKKEDWALTVGNLFYYTNPENFLEQVETTPLRIKNGVAYTNEGYVAHRSKKLVGVKRSDGTNLWIDEATWYDDKTPIFDEPLVYSGYYRPIYSEEAVSKIPSDFADYEITIRQAFSTGAIYRFPIFTDYDFVIPYASSVFNVGGEVVDFADGATYPGYDYYPDTFIQLQSNNFGILEISPESEIVKNLRKFEYKLVASEFNAEEGAFKAALKDDAFRNSKTANLNRIENDVNFLRTITGIKEHNSTSKIFFKEHVDSLDAIVPLDVNRDFLGSQEYSFDISIEDQFLNEYKTVTVYAPQARGYQEFGLSVVDPSAIIGLSSSYNIQIEINNDPSQPVVVSVSIASGDNLYGVANKIQDAFDNYSPQIYAEARVVESGGTYDLRIYSKSAGSYSTITMTITGSSDLVTALGGSFEAPVDASTFAETRWDFGQWPIYQDPSDVGIHSCIRSSGSTTANEFEPGTVGRQVFDAIVAAGFDNFTVGIDNQPSSVRNSQLYIYDNGSIQGYIDLGMSIPVASADSGLDPLSVYYFQLAVDGGALEEYSFTTSTDVSYAGVIISLNSAMRGIASFGITATNDVRITSDSYGPDSIVETADGITGVNLFGFGYPGAGFSPTTNHLQPTYGAGNRIRVKARRISTFAIHEDSIKERAIYSHNDSKIYVTPDTETDIRDHVETQHAYLTRTYDNRWSTTNDSVFTVDLSERGDWSAGAIVSKIYSTEIDGNQYLLIGNSHGQIYYYIEGEIYHWNFDPENFTLLLDADLGTNNEAVNDFFVFEDVDNSLRYLFVMTDTYIYHTDITTGLAAGTNFIPVNTSSSLSVPNVSSPVFSKIFSAESWDANVSTTVTNKYVVFVGKSDETSNWLYAPIMYALYDGGTTSFSWYAEDQYLKTQIDDIASIQKYSGWDDPDQDYQLFIANNINGPEIWTGTSQNNDTDIGGAGDDRFNRFSWSQSTLNSQNGWKDPLELDSPASRLNSFEIYDNKIFIGADRADESVVGGFYSYSVNKAQTYFKRSSSEVHASKSENAVFAHLYDDILGNSDPAIVKLFEETVQGRAQLISADNLTTVSNWPSDSAFRLQLVGFNVGGIDYDGEYGIVFDGSYGNPIDIVDSINGVLTTPGTSSGLSDAFDINNPPVQLDLTPVLRARLITSLEKSGSTYVSRYKIAIESKTADPLENSGHSGITETTQSNCQITLLHPTQGTTVVGTGTNTLEIAPNTTVTANLKLLDWSNAELYRMRRISTTGLSFSGDTYIDLTSYIDPSYRVLLGSLRVKSNSTDELGFSQGRGTILEASTTTGLANDATIYTFKVTFNENLGAGTNEITEITCPADSAGSLGGTYWTISAPNTTSPWPQYYVWYNVDRNSSDPAPGGVGIEVRIRENDSAAEVAETTAEVLTTYPDFNAISASNVVTITNLGDGNVADAANATAGITVNVTQQGVDPSFTTEWVDVVGSAAQTIQDLINEINVDLSAGTASLQALGGTAEYIDIVITSNLIGDDSSVKIEQGVSGTYLFGNNGIDIIPNNSIQGSTALNTAGSQTTGYTWENADYFYVPVHPVTGDARIYIPNGTTRIDTGATVWVDFWEKIELIKIASDTFASTYASLGTDEWTFDLVEKKVVVGEEPGATPVEDIYFVDFRVSKVFPKLDIGDTSVPDQETLSDLFHGTGPQNLENSDILVISQLARISSLHYGTFLFSTGDNEEIGANYSFFLPRADIVAATRNINEYGKRVRLIKGEPDADNPHVQVPLYEQEKYTFLYSSLVSNQDYSENSMVEIPWLLSPIIDRTKIMLDERTHWFEHDGDLISTKGLRPKHGAYDFQKVTVDDEYALVRNTEALGVREVRRRNTNYDLIDNSQVIFVSSSFGNDANLGFKPDAPKETLQAAINATSVSRPYVKILGDPQGTVDIYGSVSINTGFRVHILAEYKAEVPTLTVNGPIYIEGLIISTSITLQALHDVQAKYCDIQQISTATSGSFNDGINVYVENSVVHENVSIIGAGSLDILGPISFEFSRVYLKDSSLFLRFEPDTYDDSLENKFIFRKVTNSQTQSGNIVETTKQDGLTIEFIESNLASDTLTNFDSNASVSLIRSLFYVFTNSGAGAILSIDSQTVDVGDIDIVPEIGAPKSKARGSETDSLALNYLDRKYDIGAYPEERFKFREDRNDAILDGRSTFINVDKNRFEYNHSIRPEQFSFFIRFKPTSNFQDAGVIFDSRYHNDFNEQAGLFNNNANDFFQIVYDNKTYGVNYLTQDKYCYKLIISNGEVTNAAVISPYYTTDDNIEYSIWHELAVSFEYTDTTNAKYGSANLTGLDLRRKQFAIYTMFDRQLNRIYLPSSKPFEDVNVDIIPNSNWRPGEILTDWFNIGGGWTANWTEAQAVSAWGTWVTSSYSFIIDDFLISNTALPLNALLKLEEKEVIDPHMTNYFGVEHADKDSSLIIHCNNPHPFLDNGVEPFETAFVSFRQYEGWHQHALAIEGEYENLIAKGKIGRGNWFDRRRDSFNFTSLETITYGAASGISANEVAALVLEDNSLDLHIIDQDNNDNTIAVISGNAIQLAKMKRCQGGNYVIVYIDSSFSLYIVSVNSQTLAVGTPLQISSNTISDLDLCGGHDDERISVVYTDDTVSAGYITVIDINTNTVVHSAVEFANGTDPRYGTVLETFDSDGQPSYFVFYVETSTNDIKQAMYSEDLSTLIVDHSTLVTGEAPTDLQALLDINRNVFLKWRDETGAAPHDIKGLMIEPGGSLLVPEKTLASDVSDITFSSDIVAQQEASFLLGYIRESDSNIVFKLYNQRLEEHENSQYLRPYSNNIATGRLYINTTASSDAYNEADLYSDLFLITTFADASVNIAGMARMETEVPERWYKDVTGIFDEFYVDVIDTKSLFGNALSIRMNHAQSPGEGSIVGVVFIGDAETQNFLSWDSRVQTNGDFTIDSTNPAHRDYAYKAEYDGSGSELYIEKLGITTGPDAYLRFYIYLDKFFQLSSGGDTLEIAKFGPSADPVTLEVVFNDPLSGGDGKYKLQASHSLAGTDVTASSTINYLEYQYIDVRYYNNAVGGFQVWVDGSMVIDQTGVNVTASGNADYLIIGSTAGQAPESNSGIYFDDIRVDTSFIGEYTIGLGQSDIWQKTSISTAGEKHVISGYYLQLSGNWLLKLTGPALDNDIEIEFGLDGITAHRTSALDSVEGIDLHYINWDRTHKFEIGFIPDNTGDLEVHLMSLNSDDGDRVDEWHIDNIKLEHNDFASSILATASGSAEYPVTMDAQGSVFMRVKPLFAYDTALNHTFMSSKSIAENGSAYLTHWLYYDESSNTFKFTVQDADGNTITSESDVYGSAASTKEKTDLNEEHTIIASWDAIAGTVELIIDDRAYRQSSTPISDFSRGSTTVLGNNYQRTQPADALFDLVRVSDEMLLWEEMQYYMGKLDPFYIENKTNIGKVSVSALSFFGIQPPDEYTIYSERNGQQFGFDMVVDIGSDYNNRFVIKQRGNDIVYVDGLGLHVDGPLYTTQLIALTTSTLITQDDHITLRYGFGGTPNEYNDIYLESSRGDLTNSEIRFDESQDAWVFHDGTDNEIAITGTQIGTWRTNEHFNLVTTGTGHIKLFTQATTDGGSGSGTQNRTAGIERVRLTTTEMLVNPLQNNTDLRVSSDSMTHMFWVDVSGSKVIIGRSSYPSTSGYLVVNEATAIVYSNNTLYGFTEFRRNDGVRGGYIGYGDADAVTPYLDLFADAANYWRVTGDIRMQSGYDMYWADDTVNARLEYTNNAEAYADTAANIDSDTHGLGVRGSFSAYRIYNAIYNDYAESFEFDPDIDKGDLSPGLVYKMTEKGLIMTEERAEKSVVGVYSDTYGHLIGAKGTYKVDSGQGSKIPIGISGRVRVWVHEYLEIGDLLVSGPGGFGSKASDEERKDVGLVFAKVLEPSHDKLPRRIWVYIL